MKPYYETPNGKLYHGDCLEIMPELEQVDLTVTSPPYDSLRDYNGYDFNFEDIAKELYRITKEGGVVVWVVGDATINGSETGTSFKQALYFKEIGFNLHDTMIYKKGVVAFPSTTRYNNKMEYMFVLSKGSPKTFNGIKDHQNVSAGRKVTGKDRKKDGTLKDRPNAGNICPEYSLRGNVWHIWNQQRGKHTKHPATFPEKLAKDHIISWSNEGDTILDPMVGSGTVAKVCERLKRKWVACETSEEYCEIIVKRIEQERSQLKLF